MEQEKKSGRKDRGRERARDGLRKEREKVTGDKQGAREKRTERKEGRTGILFSLSLLFSLSFVLFSLSLLFSLSFSLSSLFLFHSCLLSLSLSVFFLFLESKE